MNQPPASTLAQSRDLARLSGGANLTSPSLEGTNMKAFLVISLVFAFCCWCVQLGGLAALNHDCNNVPADIAAYAQQQNLTNVASVFQSVSNYNEAYNYGTAPRCSVIFGLQWWITVAFFFIILGIAVCAASDTALLATGFAWGISLGVVSAILWLLCQRYNVIDWSLDNVNTPLWRALRSLKTPIQVTYAGYILESISAVLVFFAINAQYHKPANASAGSWQAPMATKEGASSV
ncbi:hypothetical protein WJX72_008770 [[Myrmecia] bisecta]|uniref:Uncharacterized protein n=1 Tax=[Myrmecia] bisecta TaxID=41462 RepID=A0AAW1R822_9CHLO